jgi:hypothetical protein
MEKEWGLRELIADIVSNPYRNFNENPNSQIIAHGKAPPLFGYFSAKRESFP